MEAKTVSGKNYSGPIVIDPVTRVEGHVKVRVEVRGGVVSDAWSTISLFRGLEQILKGRRPEDAHHFTQRTCGVCTNTHALCSVRAVEDAMGISIPENARLIRLLILSGTMLHDHIVHFYHLHSPDWVDMASALAADPVKAAKVDEFGHKNKAETLAAVQTRIKRYVDEGQLGFLTNAYFLGGHPAYKLSPEMNLIMATNYFTGLEIQRRLAQALAIVASKNPHGQTLIVGGVTCYDALKPEAMARFQTIWDEAKAFIDTAYMPDMRALAKVYPEWAKVGGNDNYFCTKDFRLSQKTDDYYFKGGVITGRNLAAPHPLDQSKIAEHVSHSWYEGAEARHPYQGETKPKFTAMDDTERYSWTKAPRYDGLPMEVGPLARAVIHYSDGLSAMGAAVKHYLKDTGLEPKDLFSTLGRTAARGIETQVLADKSYDWIKELRERAAAGDDTLCVPWTMPDEAQGVGWVAVPRGALSHWIKIKGKVIENFQLVVPSTWNCGPRCAKGIHGPTENSLIGTPIADASRPVEVLRTVHSYDPCLACSVHYIDQRNPQALDIKVL